jgi:hypothetical protein
MTRRDIDWAAIEIAWRHGHLTATQIGKAFGTTRNAVLLRAKQEGWIRDSVAPAIPAPLTGAALVTAEHRAVIRRGQALTRRLIEEALASAESIATADDAVAALDLEVRRRATLERAAAFPKRTAALRDLAVAARLWIALERQAWGLDGHAGDEAPRLDFDAALRLLDPEERDQLRRIAEILVVRTGGPAA